MNRQSTAIKCAELMGITEEQHTEITKGILGDMLQDLEEAVSREDLDGARSARTILWRRVLILIAKGEPDPVRLASWAYSMDVLVGELGKKLRNR